MKRLAALVALLALGCGGKAPPLSPQGEAMVKRFEQNLPAHKTAAFKQMCEEVERYHKDGKISDEEYQSLHKVCGYGKDGVWDRAASNLKPLAAAVEGKQAGTEDGTGEK